MNAAGRHAPVRENVLSRGFSPPVPALLMLGLAWVQPLMDGCSRAPKQLPLAVELARPRDEASVDGSSRQALVTVSSATGIGSARIRRVGARWPETVTLGLRYADGRPFLRLESLRVETDGASWSTFLGNADTVSCTGASSPDEAQVIVLPVRQRDGFLSVEIPAQSLGPTCDALRVSWIDVYRH